MLYISAGFFKQLYILLLMTLPVQVTLTLQSRTSLRDPQHCTLSAPSGMLHVLILACLPL